MPFWVILGHFGPFWVILGHFGLILVAKASSSLYCEIKKKCSEFGFSLQGIAVKIKRSLRLKIHIKCSEFGWVKNVPDGGIPFYRVGMYIDRDAHVQTMQPLSWAEFQLH